MKEIITIDCQYLRPRFAASFLMIEGNEALFVETNTSHSVPLLLKELAKQGLKPEQVRYVIVTHAHLDHSGGTSVLMSACPNATLLAHPKAAQHLIDPQKLVKSARSVYGEERFAELYGEIGPIASDRVRTMQDGETLRFGARTLTFLHTLGHANHHFCVLDSASQSIFTGDSFGLAYPDLNRSPSDFFIFPSTSPTGFDPEEAIRSVERIAASGATRAYLTHYGEVRDLTAARSQMLTHLRFSQNLLKEAAESAIPDAGLEKFCEERLSEHFESQLTRAEAREIMKLDLELNAQGIAYAALRLRQKKEKG